MWLLRKKKRTAKRDFVYWSTRLEKGSAVTICGDGGEGLDNDTCTRSFTLCDDDGGGGGIFGLVVVSLLVILL